jgi:hypothetical protein
LTEFAARAGLTVTGSVSEVGSGLGGRRPKLMRLLSDQAVTVIAMERRDPARQVRGGLHRGGAGRAGVVGCWWLIPARLPTIWPVT